MPLTSRFYGRNWQDRKSQFPEARCGGDHLECSPCGEAAGCELCQRLAWPGGAAVALAESALHYTVDLDFFQLKHELHPARAQLLVAL